MNALRRTKIVVTLGPALDDPDILERVMLAGGAIFRANFSHGEMAVHEKRIQSIRALAAKHNLSVAILIDLQGPKIRIGSFANHQVTLQEDQIFILDSDLDKHAGNEQMVSLGYRDLPKDVRADDTLLLDDGRLSMQVLRVEGSKIICQVLVGGVLSDNKGINRLGGGLSAEALTKKDHEDIKSAIRLEADYIAVSFPRSAEDIHLARALLQEGGGTQGIIAKIERAEAITNLDAITQASDAIMIARGDLGVEIGDAELPAMQKLIIKVGGIKITAATETTLIM